MMDSEKTSSLKAGQKIYFKGEKIPMEIIARSKRYAVVVREIDTDEDFDLIYFEVERGAYLTVEAAYEALKPCPVYSLLDFEKMKRAPSNLVFNPYDFWSKKECELAIEDLENGEHELSKRHGTELNIDWNKTT